MAKSTLSAPSICLMRHIEGEVSLLLALLTLGPCPKTTLCSSPIAKLQERTEKRLKKFALLNEFEPRFEQYLTRRTLTGRASRLPRPYLQPIPRTERLRHSPFYSMRSFLNTLEITPEQRQGPPS